MQGEGDGVKVAFEDDAGGFEKVLVVRAVIYGMLAPLAVEVVTVRMCFG